MATMQSQLSQKNINWKKILNIAQKGLGVVSQVVTNIADVLASENTSENAKVVSYGVMRTPPKIYPQITMPNEISQASMKDNTSNFAQLMIGNNYGIDTDTDYVDAYNNHLPLFAKLGITYNTPSLFFYLK